MLMLTCPYCGCDVDETDLTAAGEAHLKRYAAGSSDEAFEGYLFMRKNPKGVHIERWRHSFGCGKFFHVARCTQSLQVFGSYSAQTYGPPQQVVDAILEVYPRWSWQGMEEQGQSIGAAQEGQS